MATLGTWKVSTPCKPLRRPPRALSHTQLSTKWAYAAKYTSLHVAIVAVAIAENNFWSQKAVKPGSKEFHSKTWLQGTENAPEVKTASTISFSAGKLNQQTMSSKQERVRSSNTEIATREANQNLLQAIILKSKTCHVWRNPSTQRTSRYEVSDSHQKGAWQVTPFSMIHERWMGISFSVMHALWDGDPK